MDEFEVGDVLCVSVEPKDIEIGAPLNCFSCPIVKALKHFGAEVVVVYNKTGYFVYKGTSYEVHNEKDAERFIRRFDKGVPVKPTIVHMVVSGKIDL
jgi:hypothetical protein